MMAQDHVLPAMRAGKAGQTARKCSGHAHEMSQKSGVVAQGLRNLPNRTSQGLHNVTHQSTTRRTR